MEYIRRNYATGITRSRANPPSKNYNNMSLPSEWTKLGVEEIN